MSRTGKTVRWLALSVLSVVLFLSLPSCVVPFDSGDQLSTADLEARIFKLVNDHRLNIGRTILVWNDAMADEERSHSQAIANSQVPVGHQGFEDRIAQIKKIIPWSVIAENVASARSAEDALDAWLSSPDHQDIIEGDFDLTGVGVAKDPDGPLYYFSQMFLKPL
ncbi:MAG: CAP domain-containing protein [Candidatus Aminicenantes bacterium]|nr:CAP domain-containing protein [Candidatus Aminicenantes bacterium]